MQIQRVRIGATASGHQPKLNFSEKIGVFALAVFSTLGITLSRWQMTVCSKELYDEGSCEKARSWIFKCTLLSLGLGILTIASIFHRHCVKRTPQTIVMSV